MDPSPIIRRLNAIDRKHPRRDKEAVEAALARHFKSLGLWPLPVLWCNTLQEAWNEVLSRLGDENLAWDAFENRITGERPWLGPRPWENVTNGHESSESDNPILRARHAAWTAEESAVLGHGPFGSNQDLLDSNTPIRSALMTSALLTFDTPEVLQEPLPLLSMLDAAEAGLWVFWMRRNEIVAVLRPAIHFRGDRLHRDDGPALLWGDGTPWHYWHGVRVPGHAVEQPETITLSEIRAEENAEIRRVLIERYGVARYVQDIGAQPSHEDRFGTLYTVHQPDDEPIAMVKVLNATPEPDGTRKEYFLRVPPDLMTAAEAVAWTFGLRESEYHPHIET